MNTSPASPLRRASRESRGFALLITVTLLAFLVLLLVSLASLTRVETQVANNSQNIAQARQNALFALNLAIGELQKHAGPDQRVTARADVTIPPGVNITSTSVASDTLNAIDSYWRAARNRQWTGVWLNSNNNPADYDSNKPADFNPTPALQSWLVSGNENTATTFDPNTTLPDLAPTSTPLDRILDSAGRPHRLLVKASAGVSAATDLDRAVTAPEIEIRSTASPGNAGTDTPVGHYAWWVGDEGVKARANLVDPYAEAPSGEAASEKLVREITRRQPAQRFALEAMTTNGSDGLVALAPPAASAELTDYQANLLNVQNVAQLSFVNTGATLPDELKARYHDLSVSSRGVLSDTKHGGLKADLSYLFGQSNLDDFRTALRALYGTNTIAPLNPDPASLADLGNTLINPVATLRATMPTIAVDGGNYSAASQFEQTSTWEQLWSFANQGSSFNALGQAMPRLQTASQHGLYPLIIQTKMFYRLRIVGGAPDPDGVNRTGGIWIDVLPLFVLANPYAVPLAASDYQVRVSGSNPQLVFGNPGSGTPSPTNDFNNPAYASNAPSYSGNITFVLRTTGMAAGEAQIFTIDPDPSQNPTIDADDRILVTKSTDNKRVYLKNDFDSIPALTFHAVATSSPFPPITIPANMTHAALRVARNSINTILYQGYVPADPQGYRKLIQFTTAQTLTDDAEYASKENYIFIVDPISDGIRQGGGVNSIINQPPTTDRPAASPGTSAVFFSHYQAPFLQVNYRTMQIMWTGNSSYAHPLEWARRFTKNGSTGSPGTTPNPWFAANLLRPSGSTTTTRWGLVNIGEGQDQTVPPASIGGPSASEVGFINFLYDIPRPGQSLSSLGQLQHFNTTGYHPLTSMPSQVSSLSSWQTNYPLSNSYPQPRVPRDQLFNYVNNKTVSLHYHFDGSSIWNDIFWDRFTFSTYPQTEDENFDFATDKLTNTRYRPFRNSSTVAWDDESAFRGDGNPATAANSRAAAQNLLVDGAFNINSTSVEAWKAIFSSLKNVPVGNAESPSAPFARTFAPLGGSTDAATGTSPNSWNGFRDLSASEIKSLAEEMVMQIRKRGPFLSLAEFVNRRLIKSTDDTLGLGLSGALQAALDRVVNDTSLLTPAFNVKSSATSRTHSSNANQIAFAETGYILPAALAGFPGYVLQGDVLSAIGSSISARSDTFTIRTYGDAVNPATGEITGRAWCEAVVQRFPDYVEPKDGVIGNEPYETPTAGSPNATFGRRFQIVSFRWLSPDDV